MNFFKAPNDTLHALSNEDIERGGMAMLPLGSIAISDAEAEQIHIKNNPPVDPQIEVNATARAYLARTDWYVIRKQETGEAIPADVLDLRQKARDAVK